MAPPPPLTKDLTSSLLMPPTTTLCICGIGAPLEAEAEEEEGKCAFALAIRWQGLWIVSLPPAEHRGSADGGYENDENKSGGRYCASLSRCPQRLTLQL